MEKARKFIRHAETDPLAGYITLKAGHKNIVVCLKDIIVVEAMDNYVKIFRNNLPTVVPQITMKELEAMLPADCFIRIHRSFIIAVSYIEKFSNRTVYMRNFPNPIPAGRKYVTSFNSLNNIIQTK